MTVVTRKRASLAAGRRRQMSRGDKPIELPDGMWDRIAQKAYQLWDERGRWDGCDLEDWLNAEAIVMEEIHEARE